jgi:predicted nucleic acid-binding protein
VLSIDQLDFVRVAQHLARRCTTHAGKTWSLTDCVSMEAASNARVKQIATTDKHFERLGLRS